MRTPSDSPVLHRWGEYRQGRGRRGVPWWVWTALVAAVIVALGVASWLGSGTHRWRPPSGVPRFVECNYYGELSGAWCTQLAVPEDPLRPRGRAISLHIVVVPATKRPAAGALFYLEGGPGGAEPDSAIRVNRLFAEVGRDRDLVIVDQRGSGASSRLACPDAKVPARDATAVTAYLSRCFAGLRRDPRLYTSSVAAADLERVRRTLGYGKIDVYGTSYGATLAQVYFRRYARSVRSLVLDGGSLTGVRIYDVSARNAERALDAELARCAAAPACRHAFPHPRRELDAILARPPRRVSVQAGTFLLGRDEIAWTIAALSASPEGGAQIPFLLDAAAHGDYAPLGRAYADQVGPNLDARARLAMVWVILCSEPWARLDPAANAAGYLAAAAVDRARLFGRACRVVPKGRVPANAASPAVTRTPVLLLAGGDDPLDPVANLRGWRRAFPNGRLVVVPGAGHGVIGDGCVSTLVARFVARASAAGLDTACVRRFALPPFVTG
jgi:pimeloyl-ACP methyl ester carboxylesterase